MQGSLPTASGRADEGCRRAGMRSRWAALALALAAATSSCAEKEIDVSSPQVGQGQSCDPAAGPRTAAPPPCEDGLSCEPVRGGDDHVCAEAVVVVGRVFDALTRAPLGGAQVAALDETGSPAGDVAVTDVDGHYELAVSVPRDPAGEIAADVPWTLFCSAQNYLPFPGGLRPALPIDTGQASARGDGDTDADAAGRVIENAATSIGLLPLPAEQRDGGIVSGTVTGELGPGTLVVAESNGVGRYTIADASGAFTLFNVPSGGATIVGYRQGLALAPVAVGAGDHADVELVALTEGVDALPAVTGSIATVNAGGGLATSVILVPSSVYDPVLQRGPTPRGLRAPPPPSPPSVGTSFEIAGVPPGRYTVLAAFENDGLVRDPDASIAGTAIQEVDVAGTDVAVPEGFKVTQALAVIGPGADGPQIVTTPPTFEFADDASEDRYELVVFDALGTVIWEDLAIEGVSGSDTVTVPYAGPALVPGMVYQFRATSFRDTPQASTAISRTEDLRGVFMFE